MKYICPNCDTKQDGFPCTVCSHDTAVPVGDVPARSPVEPKEEVNKRMQEAVDFYHGKPDWTEEFDKPTFWPDLDPIQKEGIKSYIQQVHDSAYKQGCKNVIEVIPNELEIDPGELDGYHRSTKSLNELKQILIDKFLSN